MQISALPIKSGKVFAESATGSHVRQIPQATADPAAASFNLGFPPQTFVDESAGGTPPDGRDFNGILSFLSAWTRWQMAGGSVSFDSAFSTAIGGYPKGAVLLSTVTDGLFWFCLADNNTTNPDMPGATNWMPFGASTRGNNANGYWKQDPDGTLRQWGFALTNTLANGASAIWTAPLPKPFPNFMTGATATLGNGGVGTGSAVTAMDVGTPFSLSSDTVLPAAGATQISGFVQNNSTLATKMLIRWECVGY